MATAKATARRWLGLAFQKAHLSLSAFGQLLRWQWLIYNPLVILSFERAARTNAPKFADAVLAEFPNLCSLADVGCGTGNFAAEFQRRGLRVVGCEYANRARGRARRNGIEVFEFDLSRQVQTPLGSGYDLAICLEVAEHVPQYLADELVKYLVSTSNLVVFTAAQPGQGGHGHVNEQPQSYWSAKFFTQGFYVDEMATARIVNRLRELNAFWYLSENLLVFRRSALPSGLHPSPHTSGDSEGSREH